jgi:hypothetical protein
MNHHTTTDFWDCYNKLPEAVRKLADANCSTAPGKASRQEEVYRRRHSGRPSVSERKNRKPPQRKAAEATVEADWGWHDGFSRHHVPYSWPGKGTESFRPLPEALRDAEFH